MRKSLVFNLVIILLFITFVIGCSKKSQEGIGDTNKVNKSIKSNTNKQDTEDMEIKEKSNIDLVDYSDCFDGINGSAVFYNSKTQRYNIHNKELSEVRSSPCSTFKVISTLIGLEEGVVNSKESTMGYDGTIYSNKDWNRNLNLKEAFKYSCVWYYKKLTNQVEPVYVQDTLDDLKYGNCDISNWEGNVQEGRKNLNGFWLESSLKISPKEQTEVIAKIFDGSTIFKREHIDILKEIMFIDSKNSKFNIYGKTGTGYNENNQCVDAWFVGMIESYEDTYYFAVRLDDPTNSEITGIKAKEIALKIIEKYYS